MNSGPLGSDTFGRPGTVSRRWAAITDAVEHWARTAPASIAVSAGAEELTYSELRALVDDAASRMVRAGVRPGDRVVLSGLNSPAWIVSFLATLRIGAVIVPLNSRLGAEQLPALIDLIDPTLVLVDESQSRAFDGAGVAASRRVHLLGAGDPFEAFAFLDSEVSWRPPTLDSAAPAVLSFTSGTTGDPKGAVVSSGALVASAASYVPWMHFADTAPLSTILVPLFHNTGYVDQMSFMLTIGGQVDLIPRYRTTVAIDAMSRRPPSHLALVPSVFRMLMLSDSAETVLVNLRNALVGGAPMPSAWSVEASTRWPSLRLFHAFGLTEFTSVSHLLPADEIVEFGDSVGYPISGVRHSIRDSDGLEVQQGCTGELWVAGPTRMLEYWKRPDATADVFQGPWLKTGDVGALDDAGRLRIKGRLNQVINRGGEKILPIELEDLLSGIDCIAEAVVVGLPDPLMGERVVAGVRLREGLLFDVERAVDGLRGRIPDYAVPEQFVIVDELPYNPSGKIDRRRATTLIADLVESASVGSADGGGHGARSS